MSDSDVTVLRDTIRDSMGEIKTTVMTEIKHITFTLKEIKDSVGSITSKQGDLQVEIEVIKTNQAHDKEQNQVWHDHIEKLYGLDREQGKAIDAMNIEFTERITVLETETKERIKVVQDDSDIKIGGMNAKHITSLVGSAIATLGLIIVAYFQFKGG